MMNNMDYGKIKTVIQMLAASGTFFTVSDVYDMMVDAKIPLSEEITEDIIVKIIDTVFLVDTDTSWFRLKKLTGDDGTFYWLDDYKNPISL